MRCRPAGAQQSFQASRCRSRGRGSGFYGWPIVGYSAIAIALTAPGQTAGVSVFINPLIADLGISRTQISTAYLVGTLLGAGAMPLAGGAVDRWGPRRVIAAIGGLFGTVLIALSFVAGIVGLTAGFVGLRLAGPGALALIAPLTVAYWFDKRRGLALGIAIAAGNVGLSVIPVLVERLIAGLGWRQVWAIEGLAVWAILVPLAVFGIRNHPADLGQHVDGRPPVAEEDPRPTPPEGWPVRAAARTGMFWAMTACLAIASMLITGLLFHQIELFQQRGLSSAAAAANFLPQTAAILIATVSAGAVVDRSPKAVVVGCMAFLAAALGCFQLIHPGWTAIGYGLLLGTAYGLMRAADTAAYARYFGTAHLGAIRSIAHTSIIAAGAFGPVAISLGNELTGSYGPVLLALAVLPAAAALAVAMLPQPGTRANHRACKGQ